MGESVKGGSRSGRECKGGGESRGGRVCEGERVGVGECVKGRE